MKSHRQPVRKIENVFVSSAAGQFWHKAPFVNPSPTCEMSSHSVVTRCRFLCQIWGANIGVNITQSSINGVQTVVFVSYWARASCQSETQCSRIAPFARYNVMSNTTQSIYECDALHLTKMKSQGPDLNRRWAALQAAAFGRTLPPWRSHPFVFWWFKYSGLWWADINSENPPRAAARRWVMNESMSGRRRIEFPRGSRTPVLIETQTGLTTVFGMGTGVALSLWPP